jgi:hypothetical protein
MSLYEESIATVLSVRIKELEAIIENHKAEHKDIHDRHQKEIHAITTFNSRFVLMPFIYHFLSLNPS